MLLYNSCSKSSVISNLPQTLEETIVDQIWEEKDGNRRFLLNSSDGKLYFKHNICDSFSIAGDWILDGNYIRYYYIDGSLQVTKLWEEIYDYSASQLIFFGDSTSTTQVNIIYIAVDSAIYGCMDTLFANYNPDAVCIDTCISDSIYIPDNNFEMYLETHNGNGYFDESNTLGNGKIDNYVPTQKIRAAKELFTFANFDNIGTIYDLTGLEEFISLEKIVLDSWVDVDQVDLSNTIFLKNVLVRDSRIKEIYIDSDVTTLDRPAFSFYNCENLEKIDLTGCKRIYILELENLPQLQTINFPPTPFILNDLHIKETSISSLNLSNVVWIVDLHIYNNDNLIELILPEDNAPPWNGAPPFGPNNYEGMWMRCYNNSLDSIHSDHLSLKAVKVSNNQLKFLSINTSGLDIGGDPNLSYLQTTGNPLLNCINVTDSSNLPSFFD